MSQMLLRTINPTTSLKQIDSENWTYIQKLKGQTGITFCYICPGLECQMKAHIDLNSVSKEVDIYKNLVTA